jgi:peptidoglycan hydrolase-like protein with peptidoglycan-binding domain
LPALVLRQPRRRLLVAAAVAAVLVAACVVLAFALFSSGGKASPQTALSGLDTAVVARRDLVQHDTVSGTLGYTDTRNVVDALTGTVTWLPKPGAVIRPGQALYRVDGHAVFLFDGRSPASRTFEPGMTDGADVLELKRALRALGFDPGRQLTMDTHFDWATRAVVERWQQANGMPLTGTIPLGQVVFQPGPRRVGQLQITAGSPVTAGQVVFPTSSSERIVTGSVDASQQSDLSLGEKVSVDLLNGVVTTGRIVEIDRVATTPSSNDQQQSGGGSGGQNGNGSNSGSSSSSGSSSTLGFQVRLDRPGVAGRLDQAPVNIDVTSSKATHALSVPVTALVAQQGGGYAVQVVRNGVSSLVPVQPGFYSDDGYVQISGPGIRAGERVAVPQQ